MEFQVPARHFKTFSKAINSLGKIGPYCYFSVSQEQLELISYNDSKSVYASFKFAAWFFDSYYFANFSNSSALLNFRVQFKPLEFPGICVS
ncbi:hypothetical protein BB560_005224, partial [Smittium megazygosporum]